MDTSKGYAVLDLQNESHSLGDMDLQFQDFGDARTESGGGAGGERKHEQTIHFTDFPDSADEELEQEKLIGESESGEPSGPKGAVSFWNFEFYQQFFDVDSKQVGDRIVWSMVPKPGVSYLQSYIRPNPDLYGPFWICTTLAFTTAITGNLANYMGSTTEEAYVWKYDFHKVSLAASAIFAYAWLVPMVIWGILVWRGARAKMSLLEIICIYGYSLAIFVPVSILWVVPLEWFKWCLAIVAPVLSGGVLARTIWPSLSHDAKQIAIAVVAAVLLLHAVLALGFMLYFFPAPAKTAMPIVPVAPVSNQENVAALENSVKPSVAANQPKDNVSPAVNVKSPEADGEKKANDAGGTKDDKSAGDVETESKVKVRDVTSSEEDDKKEEVSDGESKPKEKIVGEETPAETPAEAPAEAPAGELDSKEAGTDMKTVSTSEDKPSKSDIIIKKPVADTEAKKSVTDSAAKSEAEKI